MHVYLCMYVRLYVYVCVRRRGHRLSLVLHLLQHFASRSAIDAFAGDASSKPELSVPDKLVRGVETAPCSAGLLIFREVTAAPTFRVTGSTVGTSGKRSYEINARLL